MCSPRLRGEKEEIFAAMIRIGTLIRIEFETETRWRKERQSFEGMNTRPFDGATKGFPGPRPDVFRNCRLSRNGILEYDSLTWQTVSRYNEAGVGGVSEKFNWLGGWIERRRRRRLFPSVEKYFAPGWRACGRPLASSREGKVREKRFKYRDTTTHPLSLVSFQIAFSVPFPPSGKRMFRRAINR